MKLDLIKYPEYVFGAARIEQDSDGNIILHRMTKDLYDFYTYSEGAEIRAKCTSGIRIVFKSDTESLNLELIYGVRARELFAVDIIVDNETLDSVGPKGFQDQFSVEVGNLGGHEKTIEIYLPHCSEVKLQSISITDQAYIKPIEPPKTWLAIGDSITQGMTSTTPSQTYAALTAMSLGYSLHNIAVGGAVIKGELGKLANEIKWDMATVAFGTNDFNQCRPLEDVKNDTIKLLRELAQNKGKKIALITTIPWAERTTPNDSGIYLEQYREALREAAKQFPEVQLIEGPELITNHKSFFVDDVHPNDKGMKEYATNLAKQLGMGF